MASDVEICNQALTKLGAARINDLADDTKQARALNAIFTVKRDALLAAQAWTFAIKRASIPALSTAPAYQWAAQFPLPTDCLRVIQVGEYWTLYDTDSGPAFQIEADSVNSRPAILCDEASPLRLRYIYRVTNTGLYPPVFVEALACMLAAEVCEELTQNLSKREQAWQEFDRAIKQARRINAIEQPPQMTTDPSWIRAMRDRTEY